MATPVMAIQMIIKARREARPPPSTTVSRFRPHYREVLGVLYNLGGEALVDELTAWIVGEIQRTGELPHPEAVRNRARRILTAQDLTPPEGSSLST